MTAQYFPDGWLMDGDLHHHIRASRISGFRWRWRSATARRAASRRITSESMRKMTDVVMNMIYPDYTVPQHGRHAPCHVD